MCRHDEGFFRGPAMQFVCCVEFFVLMASCYAVSRHLKESGGKSSDLFFFHASHVIFCLFFGIYHVGTIVHHDICNCDPFIVTYLVYVIFFAIMLEIFLRYWKRVTTKQNTKREYWQIRTCLYTIFVGGYVSFYLVMIIRTPCHILDGLHIFQVIFVVVAVVDLFILYFQVRARAKELTLFQNSQSAIRESYLFLAIPFSVLLAFAFSFVQQPIFGSLGQLFYWLLPSMLMLKITWKRDYLTFFDETNNVEIEWQINELRNFDSEAKRRNTSTASASSIEFRTKSKSVFRSYFASTEHHSMNLQNLLTQAPPLTSHVVIRGDEQQLLGSSSSFRLLNKAHKNRGSQYSSSSGSSGGGSYTSTISESPVEAVTIETERTTTSLSAVNAVDAGSASGGRSSVLTNNNSNSSNSSLNNMSPAPWLLIIDEDLRPSNDHSILVSAIVTGVILKPLELAFKAHKSRVDTLLKISKPKVSAALGDLEKHRQFAELKKKAVELTQEFETFLKHCRHLALPVGMVEGGYVSSFKATVNKKSKELALYTTNLNTHLSVMTKTYQISASLDQAGGAAASSSSMIRAASLSSMKKDEVLGSQSPAPVSSPVQGLHKRPSPSQTTQDLRSVSIISGGVVPEDESMLISTITFGAPCGHALGFKHGGLRKLFHKLELECNKQHSNPESTLNFMNLRFEAKAREAVVLSQGLGALVVSSIDILSRSILNKNVKFMKQFQEIGLLIHSVLMLSTHGHEECMIDDFAGAYERLHVTLRLVGPPKEKTVGFHLGDDDASSSSTTNGSQRARRGGGEDEEGGRGDGSSSRGSSIGGSLFGRPSFASLSSIRLSRANTTANNTTITTNDEVSSCQLHVADEKWKKLLMGDGGNSGGAGSHPKHVFKVMNVKQKKVDVAAAGEGEFVDSIEQAMASKSSLPDDNNSTETLRVGGSSSSFGYGIDGSMHSKMSSSVFGGDMKKSTAGSVTVMLQVNDSEHFNWLRGCLGGDEEIDIEVIPNLFNLGVNELQSIANKTGSTQMQTDVNRVGLAGLRDYHQKFVKFNQSFNVDGGEQGNGEDEVKLPVDVLPPSLPLSSVSSLSSYSNGRSSGSSGVNGANVNRYDIEAMLNLLDEQIEDEAIHKTKNVELLLTSCEIARMLNAARTTSCKSAKDRTSVFQSLEIARIAEKQGWLHRSRESELLEELRGMNGVRLRNCELNIGRPKYSFNQLQLQALPSELRPPHITCTGGKS